MASKPTIVYRTAMIASLGGRGGGLTHRARPPGARGCPSSVQDPPRPPLRHPPSPSTASSSSTRPHHRSETTTPPNEPPLRLFPLPRPPLPPRIEHVVLGATDGGPAAAVLAAHIDDDRVDEAYLRQLIALGAVYYSPTPPPRASHRLGDSDGQGGGEPGKDGSSNERRAGGVPLHHHARPRRLERPDDVLSGGGYCRVHVHPKRFPAALSTDWRRRVVAVGDGWVVVDKPMGVNVGPTVDNAVECVAQCVASALTSESTPESAESFTPWFASTPLTVTHRLDAATSGVLVLARDASFARAFNDALRRRRVRKLYRALTLAPAPLGTLEHWTTATTEGPRRHLMHPLREDDVPWEGEEAGDASCEAAEAEARVLASSAASRRARRRARRGYDIDIDAGKKKPTDPFVHPDGRVRCVLRVLSCEAVRVRAGVKHASSTMAYESTVELITGRTHQIRAQFAAEGVPLVGDVLYGGVNLGGAGVPDRAEDGDAGNLGETEEAAAVPRVLGDADRLGLQAAELTVTMRGGALAAMTADPGGVTFKAGLPWWRGGS